MSKLNFKEKIKKILKFTFCCYFCFPDDQEHEEEKDIDLLTYRYIESSYFQIDSYLDQSSLEIIQE